MKGAPAGQRLLRPDHGLCRAECLACYVYLLWVENHGHSHRRDRNDSQYILSSQANSM
jgi:hypothetical protein